MAEALTGMSLNDAYQLTLFKSDVNETNYRVRFGSGGATPWSVTGNTNLFATLSPDVVAPFLPVNYGGVRAANYGGSGSAFAVGTTTSSPSSSGDRSQYLLVCGSVGFLAPAVAGKATKVTEVRKTVTATATTCLNQFQIAARNTGSDSTEDRIIEANTYYDSANPANNYKEFKFGGFGASYGDSAQMVFHHDLSTGTGYFGYGVDNKISVFTVTNRASVIYAATGTINTSDEREKDREEINDAERAAALEIKKDIWKYRRTDSIEEKGDSARYHFGVGAQSVGDIMRKHGLNPELYAFYCYDEWGDEFESEKAVRSSGFNEAGEELFEQYETGKMIQTQKAGSRYGIRYDELLCFIMAAL